MHFTRVRIDSRLDPAYYHLINRIVGGQWLLGDLEKEVLRKHIWATAAYCGLVVLTYVIMSNHYHVLVLVPKRRPVPDAELLKRYRAFHRRLNKQQRDRLDEIEQDMLINGPLAQHWREQQLRQMFDISKFGALLDQRFSIWYNRTHNRKGTLWMRRFKSVLVEDGDALRNMAIYIDMNPCRAGIVSDPKDYRFCGYAEATAGLSLAREGLLEVFRTDWTTASSCYRAHLIVEMRKVAALREQAGLPMQAKNPPQENVTNGQGVACRIRYFVDGMILGSAAFVREKSALIPGPRQRPPRLLSAFGLPDTLHSLGRMPRSDMLPA